MDVCEPLMPRCVAQNASELLQLSGPTFGFTTREFSMVGSYTENPEKPQNCQNWGGGRLLGNLLGKIGIMNFEVQMFYIIPFI